MALCAPLGEAYGECSCFSLSKGTDCEFGHDDEVDGSSVARNMFSGMGELQMNYEIDSEDYTMVVG